MQPRGYSTRRNTKVDNNHFISFCPSSGTSRLDIISRAPRPPLLNCIPDRLKLFLAAGEATGGAASGERGGRELTDCRTWGGEEALWARLIGRSSLPPAGPAITSSPATSEAGSAVLPRCWGPMARWPCIRLTSVRRQGRANLRLPYEERREQIIVVSVQHCCKRMARVSRPSPAVNAR